MGCQAERPSAATDFVVDYSDSFRTDAQITIYAVPRNMFLFAIALRDDRLPDPVKDISDEVLERFKRVLRNQGPLGGISYSDELESFQLGQE